MAKANLLEVKKQDVELILTYDEAEFLYRLLGNHIVGGGKNRDMSNEIHKSLSGLRANFNRGCFDCDFIDVTEYSAGQ